MKRTMQDFARAINLELKEWDKLPGDVQKIIQQCYLNKNTVEETLNIIQLMTEDNHDL